MKFFSNMSRKEKAGIMIAATVVLLVFMDRLVVSPIAFMFKKIDNETKRNEQQLAQSLRNLTQKDDIAKEYQKYLKYIKSNYSEGEEVSKLLEEIENIARGSGISVGDIKPQPPRLTDTYKYYTIELEVEGKMDTLLAFLHQLAGSKELFRATKVYITLKEKETSTVKASILVTKVVVT